MIDFVNNGIKRENSVIILNNLDDNTKYLFIYLFYNLNMNIYNEQY